MTETLTHGGYWSENNQWELTTEYQYDRFEIVNEKSLRPYALDESSRIIGRVKENLNELFIWLDITVVFSNPHVGRFSAPPIFRSYEGLSWPDVKMAMMFIQHFIFSFRCIYMNILVPWA